MMLCHQYTFIIFFFFTFFCNLNHILKEKKKYKEMGTKPKPLSETKAEEPKQVKCLKPRETIPTEEPVRRTTKSTYLESFARLRLLLLSLLLFWNHQMK